MSITPQIEAHVAGVPFGRNDESGWRLILFGLFQGSKRAKATGTFAVNQIKVAVVPVGKQIRDLAVLNPSAPMNLSGTLIDVVHQKKHQRITTEEGNRVFSVIRDEAVQRLRAFRLAWNHGGEGEAAARVNYLGITAPGRTLVRGRVYGNSVCNQKPTNRPLGCTRESRRTAQRLKSSK